MMDRLYGRRFFLYLTMGLVAGTGWCDANLARDLARSVAMISDEEGSIGGLLVSAEGVMMTPLNGVLTPLPQEVQAFVNQNGRAELRTFPGVEFIGAHPKLDLAWVQIKAPPGTRFFPMKRARQGPNPDDRLYIGGLGDGFFAPVRLQPKVREARMKRLQVELKAGGETFLSIDGFAGLGMDGGFVCNAAGELVGVISLRPEQYEDRSQSYAIPTWWLRNDEVQPLSKRPPDIEWGKKMNDAGNDFADLAKRVSGDAKLFLQGLSQSCYQYAICAVPLHPAPYFNMGLAYIAQDRIDLAVPYLKRSLALDPKGDQQHYVRGFLAYQEGDVKNAVGHWVDGLGSSHAVTLATCASALAIHYEAQDDHRAAAFLARWSLSAYDPGRGPDSDDRRARFRRLSQRLSDAEYGMLVRMDGQFTKDRLKRFAAGKLAIRELAQDPTKVRAMNWDGLRAAHAKAPPLKADGLGLPSDVRPSNLGLIAGRYLASITFQGEITLYDVLDGRAIPVAAPNPGKMRAAAPAGADLLVICDDGERVAVCAPETGAVRTMLEVTEGWQVLELAGSIHRNDFAVALTRRKTSYGQLPSLALLHLGTGKLLPFSNYPAPPRMASDLVCDPQLNSVYFGRDVSQQGSAVIDWVRLDLYATAPKPEPLPQRLKNWIDKQPPVLAKGAFRKLDGTVVRQDVQAMPIDETVVLEQASETKFVLRRIPSWEPMGGGVFHSRVSRMLGASVPLARMIVDTGNHGTRILPLQLQPEAAGAAAPQQAKPTGSINPAPLTLADLEAHKKDLPLDGIVRDWPDTTLALMPIYGSAYLAAIPESASSLALIAVRDGSTAAEIPFGADDFVASAQRILVILRPHAKEIEIWDLDGLALARRVPLRLPAGLEIESFGMGREVPNAGLVVLRGPSKPVEPPTVAWLNPVTGQLTKAPVTGKHWHNANARIVALGKRLHCAPRLEEALALSANRMNAELWLTRDGRGFRHNPRSTRRATYPHAFSEDGQIAFGTREVTDERSGKTIRPPRLARHSARVFPIFGSELLVCADFREVASFDPDSGEIRQRFKTVGDGSFTMSGDGHNDFFLAGSGPLNRIVGICNRTKKLHVWTLVPSETEQRAPKPMEGLPPHPVDIWKKLHWSLAVDLEPGVVVDVVEKPEGLTMKVTGAGNRKMRLAWPPSTDRTPGAYKFVFRYGYHDGGPKRTATIHFDVKNK